MANVGASLLTIGVVIIGPVAYAVATGKGAPGSAGSTASNGDYATVNPGAGNIASIAPSSVLPTSNAIVPSAPTVVPKPVPKTAADRKSFANSRDLAMLDAGKNVEVSALGKDATILQVKYILMSRATAHQIINKSSLPNLAEKEGFKRLVLTDGYRAKWVLDLKTRQIVN